jgi:ribonuclease BN (tRNA processing enzyme)
VQVLLVPSSANPRRRDQDQFLSTTLINGTVAIDAGCLGLWGTPDDQARVRHVFLTHSHMDHLASLPVFLNQAYDGTGDCVTIHAPAPVLDSLRSDVFNDRLWPDFVRISKAVPPYLKVCEVHPRRPVEVEGLTITAIPVHHAVPTVGYVVRDDHSSVMFPSDTGPTEEIWQHARALPDLKAVFLEVTFPDHMAALAEISCHLTPALFRQEAEKLGLRVPFHAVHIHPRHRTQVVKELKALGMDHLEIGRFGVPYEF